MVVVLTVLALTMVLVVEVALEVLELPQVWEQLLLAVLDSPIQ
jgi:uncharacterized protein YjeT (DUF2065 family)